MQSRNPVFARSEGFNGRANAYGNQTYAGNGQAYAGFGQTDTWGAPSGTAVDQGRMTIDSVVQKTAITLAVVFVAAAITWLSTGDITASGAAARLYTLAVVGSIGGFTLSMVNSFKRVISPPLVIAYAALEGIAIGAFSKAIESSLPTTTTTNGVVHTTNYHGVVIMAVLGTFVAVGATLAVYKFFNIRVGNRFRTWVIAAAWGFVGLSVLDFVLGMFHSDFGFNNPFSPFAIIISFVGLAIGIFMLIMDFDYVERGVAAGLPERESWRAAFGLTVTIVWIYIEMLRLAAELTRR